MLRRSFCIFFISVGLMCNVALAQQTTGQQKAHYFSAGFPSIESGFVKIPDSIQTSVYWYWLSGNISKEGVVKDLEAMKKVGINRAFIGNIGLDNVPEGKVKMFSDKWWSILHTALKTATRLNIEIGIFNGPGWSQSGGPWVKPQQAMRYLTSSDTVIKGPQTFHQKLSVPQKDFADVKVIAYPVPSNYFNTIKYRDAAFITTPGKDSMRNLMDDNLSTFVPLARNEKFQLDVRVPVAFTARSISIALTPNPVQLEGDILAEIKGVYVSLKHFYIDRSNPALNTGFIPYGPAVISIPATTAKNFRIIFNKVSNNSGIAELKISAAQMVDQFMEKTLAKMWPTPHPMWDAYQWERQAEQSSKYTIDPKGVVDISRYMQSDGTLSWRVPAGTWVIERTGMVPTNVTNGPASPEATGLETDKMSIAHIREHFDAFMGEIIKRIPAEDRKTWKVVVQDSYETGGQNWTDSLIAEFKHTYDYDPVPYMPVLQGKVVGNAERSDRFLWDLRRLIADDVAYKYVGGLRDISHQNGMTTWLENYGHWGFPGEFLQYGGQSDEVGGEFWGEGTLGDIENRAAASSAHIYGKIKVSAESFTDAGNAFARYPAMFKKRGDRFFTEGINTNVLHVYIQQPEDQSPGTTAWFGVEFNRLNTWFFDMDVFVQYLKRCNLMLQQGQYVADAVYFIGEDAPKMTGVTDPPLPAGFSYDYINGEVIREKLFVENGKLTLPNGIKYSVLVLPKLETMRPELLMKIQELVRQGAVVLGPKPTRAPGLKDYPAADNMVQKMAAELWGKVDGVTTKINSYGKGLVTSGMELSEVFDKLKVIPDVKISGSDSVLFIHRQLENGDIYFLSNQSSSKINFDAQFRTTGKSPELWNPLTSVIRALPVFRQTDESTTVPLQLAPLESALIVFRNKTGKENTTKSNYPEPVSTMTVKGPWIVNFDKLMRGPVAPVIFDSLTDWSVNKNDSIRYYSGSAQYNNRFKIDAINKNAHYFIDLGRAIAIAKVRVNGTDVGGAWTPPYQLDITNAVKAGENNLQITVTNTWVNRLVGDSKLPVEQRKATALFGPDPKRGLQLSGLLGPVKISEIIY